MTVRKIVCPDCNTVYKVDAARIPNGGSRSKCIRCDNIIVINENPPDQDKTQSAVNKDISFGPSIAEPRESALENVKRNDTPLAVSNLQVLEQVATFREQIQDYFKDDDDELVGFPKFAYIFLKVLAALVACNFIIFFLGLLLPSIIASIIGASLFVLLLNWKTLADLANTSAYQDILFKEKWAQLTLPFILVNLYVILAQSFDTNPIPMLLSVLFIALFLILPFYINYKLAVRSDTSVPLTMLLTLFLSWLLTIYFTFMSEENEA